MRRALFYLPLMVLWSLLVFGCAFVSGLITLGFARDHLADFWAPKWGRGILWLAGVKLRLRGWEHLQARQARVVLLNHSSFLDMVCIGAACPPGMIALIKKEFAYLPIVNVGFWAAGQHFVDRNNRSKAIASVARLAKRLSTRGGSVVVFPEGTRSQDGSLQPFKLGAFHLLLQTQVPYVPVVIHGAHALSQPGRPWIQPGEVVMEAHPPRSTQGWTEAELRVRAAALRDEYAAWLAAGPGGGQV